MRRELRSFVAMHEPIYAAVEPEWVKQADTAEVLAQWRKLLGFTVIAEEASHFELRSRFMPARAPMPIVFLA